MFPLERLYPGDQILACLLVVVLAVTLLSTVALVLSQGLKARAALRHCVLLSALIGDLATPILAALWFAAGCSTVSLGWLPSARTGDRAVAPVVVESAPDFARAKDSVEQVPPAHAVKSLEHRARRNQSRACRALRSSTRRRPFQRSRNRASPNPSSRIRASRSRSRPSWSGLWERCCSCWAWFGAIGPCVASGGPYDQRPTADCPNCSAKCAEGWASCDGRRSSCRRACSLPSWRAGSGRLSFFPRSRWARLLASSCGTC